MADPKTVPGQMNQPEKSDLRGPSYGTDLWDASSHPKVDYAMDLPLQETTPLINKAWDNDSDKPAFPRTANDINGGGEIEGWTQ